MKKHHVQLSKNDRIYLEELLSKGELPVKTYRRALALLELARGKTYTAVAETTQSASLTVSKWSRKYREVGLNMLIDQPRAGRPPEIDGTQR